jgi:hypothetical protein
MHQTPSRGWGRAVTCCLVAALIQFLVGFLFGLAFPVIAPGIPRPYENGALFRPWIGWTSTYMYLHPFGHGIVFALAYFGLKAWSAFPSGWCGGCAFGNGIFLVGSLPLLLMAYAWFTVPAEVMASWVVQNACQYLLAGGSIGALANRCGGGSR